MTSLYKEINALVAGFIARQMAPIPAPKILFYVDDERFRRNVVIGMPGKFEPVELAKVLATDGYEIAYHGREDPLSAELLQHFAEIWFFLGSKSDAQPLSDGEIAALRAWMDRGGGVLLTGDHAEPASGDPQGVPRGLGRAVGSRVPRARHLREWGERPGLGDRSNDSTWTPGDERDGQPQRLLVRRPVHPIFSGKEPQYFPDHPHEGAVRAPDLGGVDLEGGELERWRDEWLLDRSPVPSPELIADCVNWSRGETFPLMAVWDGQAVDAGRIVADASWHHYVRYNLKEIGGEPSVHSIFDVYLGEAWWLLPRALRVRRIAKAITQAAELPAAVDYEHTSVRELGRMAVAELRRTLSRPAFAELLAALWEGAPRGEGLKSDEFDVRLIGTYIKGLRARLDGGAGPESLVGVPGDGLRGIVREAAEDYAKELKERALRLEELASIY